MSTQFLTKKNNAKSTLASGIGSGDTSLSVQTGDGAKFPSAPFQVTLYSSDPSAGEIVKVTGVSTDTFTIVRAQEGTTAQAWSAGAKVELLVTAKLMQDLDNAVNNLEKRVQVVVATDGSGDYNCDGTADQTEINQAISDLPSSGGIVHLKAGTYNISGTINCLKSNVTIQGEGKTTKIFLANSSNCDMLYIGNGSTVANDCVVENIFFDPNYANQSSLGASVCFYGTSGTHCVRNVLRGCRFTQGRSDNVKLMYADKCIVSGNTFDGAGTNSGAMVGIFTSSQCNDVTGNVFMGVGYGYGVYSNSNYNNISGNVFLDFAYGIYLSSVYNCTIAGNSFLTLSYYQTSVYISAGGRHTITGNNAYQPSRLAYLNNSYHNTITGNSAYYAYYEGIYLYNDCRYNAIAGNVIYYSNYHGIRMQGSYNSVNGNVLRDNGRGANNTYADILLDEMGTIYSTYNAVIGNTCTATATNKVAYSVRETSANDNYNLVDGNVCSGGATAQISLQGANSVRGTNIPASG